MSTCIQAKSLDRDNYLKRLLQVNRTISKQMGRQLMIISQIQDRQLLLMPKNHRNRTIFKLEGQETHYFKQIAGDNS